ncbi:MAG: tetratricopeptide repeat protein [Victivallaceae bacterium]
MRQLSKTFWILLGAGVLLRAEYLREFAASPLFGLALGPDIAEYYQRSQEILAGAWFNPLPEIHAPLYSWVLASLLWLHASIPLIRAAQLALNVVAWVFFYRFLRRRVEPDSSIPEWTFGWAMFYTPLIFHQAELVSESVLTVFILGLIWCVSVAEEKRSWRCGAAGGVFAALAILTHPVVLLPVAAEALYLFFFAKLRRPALVFALTAAVLIAPFSIYQSMLAGRPVPVQANSAFNLYLGNHEGADGSCMLRPGRAWTTFHRAAAAEAESRGISVDRLHAGKVIDFWTGHPFQALALFGRKALITFSPSELPAGADTPAIVNFTPVLSISGVALAAILMVTALTGIGVMARRREFGQWHHFLIWGGAIWAMQILTVCSGRYRISLLPVLFVLSAYAITRFVLRDGFALGGAAIAVGLGCLLSPRAERFTPETRSLYAEALYRQRRYAEAAARLALFWRDSNDPARDGNMLGRISYEIGNRGGAAAVYHVVAAAVPESGEALMNLGTLAAEEGDAAGAKRYYEAALARDPDLTDAVYNLALLAERGGDAATAEKLYLRILSRKPSHRPSLNALGVLAYNRGDDDAAELFFANALLLDPGHPGLRRNLEAVRHRKLEKLK